MTWKTAFRSIYYDGAPEPQDPDLDPAHTALLVIDVQNTYLERPDRATLSPEEQKRYDAWTSFHERMHSIVIPRSQALLQSFRKAGIECIFARIACHTKNGRDRSLSQKMPGWNNLLLPKDELPSQVIPELAPINDEIVMTKTTDSALTGTNLRLTSPISASRPLCAAGSSPTNASLQPCEAWRMRALTLSSSRIAAPPAPTSSTARSSRSST